MRNSVVMIVCVGLAAMVSGCSVFLPAHSRSNKRGQERVAVRLLTYGDLANNPEYVKGYEQAFGPGSFPEKDACVPHLQAEAVPAAALASVAVGFAVDFIKKKLEEEATLYEAQFSGTAVDDRFWCKAEATDAASTKRVVTTTRREKASSSAPWVLKPPITEVAEETLLSSTSATWAQRYYGFEVVRSVECDWLNRTGDSGCRRNASRLAFAIKPSADRQLLRLAPMYYQADFVKAKVLSDQWFSWLVLPVFGKFVKIPGHYADVDINVELTGYWKSPDQTLQTTPVAAFSTSVNGYDLDTAPPLHPGDGLGPASGGWLLTVPVSYGPDGSPAVGKAGEAGAFALRVLVTERDTSNAKQYLTRAAELVGEKKGALVDLVK